MYSASWVGSICILLSVQYNLVGTKTATVPFVLNEIWSMKICQHYPTSDVGLFNHISEEKFFKFRVSYSDIVLDTLKSIPISH
jgi:hypothetical protein